MNNNNTANQKNPNNPAFIKSRGCDLSKKDVATIQRTEIQGNGKQDSDGLGAQAQRQFENIQKGKCGK